MRKLYFLLFVLLFTQSLKAQLTGVKTIPGDYPTIADAVSALNAQGVGNGGVIFSVSAGHSETSNVPVITASGNSSDQIIFQKSGTGANPKIVPLMAGTIASTTTLGSNGDGIIIINGGDYITFDGIDLQTNASFSAAGMYEYGYYLKKASGSDASKNITIKNCVITLNKAAIFSFGIFVSNISGTATVTVTSTDGRSENIKIYGNTITNAYGGIQLRGFASASPYELYDQNIEVGVDGANTINNYGGAGSAAYGIYAIYQNELKIANNVITGGAGTTTTTYGIFTTTSINSNIDIYNNEITLQSAATTSSVYGINNAGGGTGTTNTVNLYNNTIKDVNWTTASSGDFYGVYNSATAKNVNLYGNTVQNIAMTGTTGIVYSVYNSNTAASGVAAVYNNIVRNITGPSTVYGVYSNPVSTSITTVNNNTIHNLSGSSVYGITFSSGATSSAFRNRIFDLASTANTVYGLYIISAATNGVYNLYNNIIGNLTAPIASSTSVAVSGIHLASTATASTYNVSFNTVYLNAASSGANFSSAALYHTYNATATSGALVLQNNILVNLSTPKGTGYTAALRRSSATNLNNYNPSSDRNIFYAATGANSVLYYDGTNASADIPSFITHVTPRETNSKRELPPFINTTNGTANDFLHLNTTQPTYAESGGIAVSGIDDDFDGNIRQGSSGYSGNGTAPDIGADEFEGSPILDCSGTPTPGTITGAALICTGTSTVLSLSGQTSAQGITYSWKFSTTPGGPYTTTSGTGAAFNTGILTQPTYFVVDVTCTLSGQTITTLEFAVNLNALPNVTVTPNSANVCSGTIQALTVAGATSYTWTPVTNLYLDANAATAYTAGTNATTVYSRPTTNRVYTVSGTDANGCVDTAVANVYFVASVGTANATASSQLICQNGSTQLNVTVPAYTSYSAIPIAHSPIPTPGGGISILVENGSLVNSAIKGTLDDGRWDSIPLPFNFNFYGTDYDKFHISTNGFISFSTFNLANWSSQTIPSTTDPDNGIHIVHTDLDLSDSASPNGRIEYFEDGSVPNRRFVINYVNVGFFELTKNPGKVTVQVVLHEGTNRIEIHTTEVSNNTVNKTQGVEGPLGSVATAVPGRNATKEWGSMPSAYAFEPVSLTYTWTPSTYLNNPNIQNPVASNVTSNVEYFVVVAEPYTGCSSKDSVEITAGVPLTAATTVSSNLVCAGNSVNLAALPSGGGTPYTYSWSNGTAVVSTDSTFNATPASTTTYTLTISDACNQQATANVTITVNDPKVLVATGATRCGTGPLTLTASGTPGAALNWYNTATGGTALATGDSYVTPSISATTTYYVSASQMGNPVVTARTAASNPGSATTLSTYGMDFTVTQPFTLNSVDVFSSTGSAITIKLYSAGGTTELQTTGSVTTAPGVKNTISLGWQINPGTYRLFIPAMTGSFYRENSGAAYPVALVGASGPIGQVNGFVSSLTGTVTTSASWYFMYNWSITSNCESARTAVTATVNPVTTLAASTGGPQVCDMQNVSDNMYTDNSCGMIAKVVPSGAAPVSGNVNSCVKIDATVQVFGNSPYVQRHFDIEPATNASTATATVTFYVLQSEFDAYNSNNGAFPDLPTGPSDNTGISNLRITQFGGTGTAPGNYTGGAKLIDPSDAAIVWNATNNWWEITIDVAGFSGFYIHTILGTGPLPANLLAFSGSRQGNVNNLKWVVAQEQDVLEYEVERSDNGRNWNKVGSVNSLGNTTSQRSYAFTDNNISGTKQLYRLRQVDVNGTAKLSNIISITGAKSSALVLAGLFPNPAASKINVLVNAPSKDNITIAVMDAVGRVVKAQRNGVDAGSNTVEISLTGLAQGTYMVKITCDSNCEPAVSRFVKE